MRIVLVVVLVLELALISVFISSGARQRMLNSFSFCSALVSAYQGALSPGGPSISSIPSIHPGDWVILASPMNRETEASHESEEMSPHFARPLSPRPSCWGVGLGLVVLAVIASLSRAVQGDGVPRAYPLYVAGIVVGMSTETDVRRMFGDGLFRKDEGHSGGRYYVDPKRTVTLHVEFGVDRVIEYVSYARGIRLPPPHRRGAQVPAQAITARLTSNEHLSGGVRLGDPEGQTLRVFDLGSPTSRFRRGSEHTVRFDTDYEKGSQYVLFYQARFHFSGGRLTAIELYNGE